MVHYKTTSDQVLPSLKRNINGYCYHVAQSFVLTAGATPAVEIFSIFLIDIGNAFLLNHEEYGTGVKLAPILYHRTSNFSVSISAIEHTNQAKKQRLKESPSSLLEPIKKDVGECIQSLSLDITGVGDGVQGRSRSTPKQKFLRVGARQSRAEPYQIKKKNSKHAKLNSHSTLCITWDTY
ncbi:hypothetical protein C5167_021906 [Papaver somniferum]|uniref:Uncharacterized protein n=1 Tax=Papaver somniferum TaxID=3469 RepID=A0A4Y7JGD6_PAPSO|nr:hypothetical protein C5167_021906 [Papaver somniferum]